MTTYFIKQNSDIYRVDFINLSRSYRFTAEIDMDTNSTEPKFIMGDLWVFQISETDWWITNENNVKSYQNDCLEK